MSKVLQWIIGIGVVVMAAAFVFASAAPLFLARNAVGLRMPMMAGPAEGVPFFMGQMFGAGRLGLRTPFFALFELVRCLWPVLLVGLIVWAFTVLARRPAPMAGLPPVMPTAMPAATPPAPADMAGSGPASAGPAVCSNCGQPLQAGWRHCPSCGQAVNQ